jgi:hypothetical protein
MGEQQAAPCPAGSALATVKPASQARMTAIALDQWRAMATLPYRSELLLVAMAKLLASAALA